MRYCLQFFDNEAILLAFLLLHALHFYRELLEDRVCHDIYQTMAAKHHFITPYIDE
jgi:hypothetical protein